jgi:7-cyano-7-deazaguanine reductase
MPSHASNQIETFDNPALEHDYTIRMSIPEFTCLCPRTGQPDFATLELEYVPDRLCIELKSLKLYIWSFRDRGSFHEAVTNQIIDHLARSVTPRFIRLSARFHVRGGIATEVIAERRAANWRSAQSPTVP